MLPEGLENLTISSGDLDIPFRILDKESFGSKREYKADLDEAPVELSYQVPQCNFQYNEEAMQFLAKNNFPILFRSDTMQSTGDEEAAQNVEPEFEETDEIDLTNIEGDTDKLFKVESTKNKAANDFVKIWNDFVKIFNPSKTNYDLIEYEARYAKYTIDDALVSIGSNLDKPYCGNDRYQNVGSALFPTKNKFSKIQKRSLAKLEATDLIKYYMDEQNQCIIIPIEFTSRMSRSFSFSHELSQLTGACNKIQTPLNCNWNIKDLMHPLSTMGYKDSIEEEVIPASNLCLMDNFSKILEILPDICFRNKNIQNALYNYVYISHVFDRSEFWIDDLYVKMWHYARSFCDKVQFSNRAVPEFVLITKDTIFRYLLEHSLIICIAIKTWVTCKETSTYFRCWCGHKAYHKDGETRMINRFGIGSHEMLNAQFNVQNKNLYHKKHANDSMKYHMCPCGDKFDTHKEWIQHTFSTKIYDLSKACPIVLHNFMKLSLSTENRKFQCECDAEFGDYDFWEFWLHVCGCKTMKKSVNASCVCCNKFRTKASKRANSRAGQSIGSKRQKY